VASYTKSDTWKLIWDHFYSERHQRIRAKGLTSANITYHERIQTLYLDEIYTLITAYVPKLSKWSCCEPFNLRTLKQICEVTIASFNETIIQLIRCWASWILKGIERFVIWKSKYWPCFLLDISFDKRYLVTNNDLYLFIYLN
jgi:hypothetical protein